MCPSCKIGSQTRTFENKLYKNKSNPADLVDRLVDQIYIWPVGTATQQCPESDMTFHGM